MIASHLPLARLGRRLLRALVLAPGPSWLRQTVRRAPSSRFERAASWVLWGSEEVDWYETRVEVNPGEVHGFYVYFFGDYDRAEIEALISLCRNARVFVDIGANIGLVSLAVAQRCPDLTVFAFEPDRVVFGRLQRNVLLNQDLSHRVRAIESAISEDDGIASFVPTGRNSNVELGRLALDANERGYPVRVRRMDSLFGDDGLAEPDVVKIDVEGAELHVLRGMAGLFARGLPRAVLLETHAFTAGAGASAFNATAVELLTDAGFTVHRLAEDEWTPVESHQELGSREHLLGVRRD